MQIPVLSTHTGLPIEDGETLEAEIRAGRSPRRDLDLALKDKGIDAIITLGYNTIGEKNILTGKYEQDKNSLLHCLAQLFSQGVRIAWSNIYQGQKRNTIALPGYPFAKVRCWPSSAARLESQAQQRTPLETVTAAPKPAVIQDKKDLTEPVAAERSSGPGDEINVVKEIISQVLKIDPGELDENVRFEEYGMDSMFIRQAVDIAEQHYGMPIQASIFYEYPTAALLAEHLKTYGRITLPPPPEPAMKPRRQAPAQDSLAEVLDRFLSDSLSLGEAEKIISSLV
jgi:acyl transferase domain-containing protein